ncbi:PEP-CTERM sorting domain-containing protein [Microcystis aeruginosa CS-558/01A06]|nr:MULTISPECIES: PEP-CTERM sorting domain-containing protein [Microcystis]MDB9407420.1 PEP-CTERM sorting domain-containing protein [Microcystis aeruginosa CS-558/01A06]
MFTPGGTVNSFAQINVGGGTTVNITPTVASGTFNTSGGMSTTVYTVMGTAFFDATTGLDYSGVFSLNVVSVGSGWIYTLSLEKSSLAVPEPSAILGILAVVGAGAFARRKS